MERAGRGVPEARSRRDCCEEREIQRRGPTQLPKPKPGCECCADVASAVPCGECDGDRELHASWSCHAPAAHAGSRIVPCARAPA